MATELIPKDWRDAVCAILEAREPATIDVKLRAKLAWEATFPDASWSYVMYEEFRKYLSRDDAAGREVATMNETGRVYEFIFECMDRLIYGKINLRPDGKLLIIYSAHPPDKGDEL